MANLPIIAIITAAAKDDANLVWEAMGRGPGNFGHIKLTTNANADSTATPTHYLMADSSTTEAEVAMLQAMAGGDLPAINGVWGEGGLISAAAAQAAISGANLQVYSASGNVEPLDHMIGILAGRSLYRVPAPEF